MNLAIIGYGGMAEHHVAYYIDKYNKANPNDGIKVFGIYDIDEKRIQKAKKDGLEVYYSAEDIFKDPLVDCVLIATPNDVHCSYAIKAAEAKKHIIMEKPVAMSTAEAEKMYDSAEKNGVYLMVHQNRRWDDDYLTIKNIINKGLLGEVYNIESRVMGSNGIPGEWRREKAKGGGMLLDWGVHLIDQLVIMIDSPVTDIYCKCSYMLGEEVDDGFTALLTFKNGITATVTVDTNCFINLPRWQLYGINGTAVVNDWDLNGKIVNVEVRKDSKLKMIKAGNGFTKTMADRSSGTIKEVALEKVLPSGIEFYENVCKSVAGKEEPFVKRNEVIRVFKLMEACFLSSETEQRVKCNI